MARLLLDTHAFLWWVDGAPELTEGARLAIADPGSTCFLSLASCWEMAVKASLGKLRLAKPVERFVVEQLAVNGFKLLNIGLNHVAGVEKLPFHHRDLFDRLLIVQAMTDKLTLVSADKIFADYGVKRVW
jgi:PIN domain nuclease of toxin-antitoxin system